MASGSDHSALNKQIILKCLAIFSAIIGFLIWALKQKPDELKGPPITLTIQAQLDPGMESENIQLQLLREGGKFSHRA